MRRLSAARAAERLAQRAAERTVEAAFGVNMLPGASRSTRVSPWVEVSRALRAAVGALLLSVVPGLWHARHHQFGRIYLYVISWFVSLTMGILYFGSSLGGVSMASAFVLHAWIAMDAVVSTKQFKEEMTALARIGWRLFGIGFAVFLLYGAYMRIQREYGFTVGVVGMAVPAYQVELRDSILCRLLAARSVPPPLKRADLVLVGVNRTYAGDGSVGKSRGYGYLGETVGQLIALPGDELALTPDGFAVNGRALDALNFPVPVFLNKLPAPPSGRSASLRLGKDEFFVTLEERASGHGVALDREQALRVFVYDRQDVLARGFMRWFPIRKRGFLKALE